MDHIMAESSLKSLFIDQCCWKGYKGSLHPRVIVSITLFNSRLVHFHSSGGQNFISETDISIHFQRSHAKMNGQFQMDGIWSLIGPISDRNWREDELF